MRQRILFLILATLCFWQVSLAQNRIVGDVLVMLKHGEPVGITLKTLQERFPQAEVHLGETVAPTLNIWLLKVNPAYEYQVLDYLRLQPQVQVVQFNRIAEERLTPNDSLYPSQWNLENTGQGSGTPGADVKASLAWDITTGGFTGTGDTIVVAVIDKGTELTHPDLVYWQNPHEIDGDGIDNDGNGYIDDIKGWNVARQDDSIPNAPHGTMCGGIIGGKTNNVSGTAGINWGIPIMPVVCTQYSESQVVAAYAYILETRRLYNQTGGSKGAFVVATNSSFGIDFALAADYPIWCAMYDSLGKQGILSAGATANINLDVEASGDIPSTCASDFLLVVTNTTRTDFKNPGSGYGSVSVDLGAPGTGIWSTTSGHAYSASTGTSFATPHVAGAVALLLSAADSAFMDTYRQYPDSMAREIKRIILQTVDVLPGLVNTTSGGRLNLYKALVRFQNEFCTQCLVIHSTVQHVDCYGDSTGTITVAVDSGRSPFIFAWSTGDTTATVAGLQAGNYTVTVTDSLGNTRQAYFTVTQPIAPLQTGYIVHRSKGTDGSIKVLVEGGTPPYQYAWQNNVGTGDSAINLVPGVYGITITDQNGCFKADTVTVYQDTLDGIAFVAIQNFILYPNPVDDLLHFELQTNASGMLELEILDVLGRQVRHHSQPIGASKTQGMVALDGLTRGVYLVRIRLNGQVGQVHKLLKQ